MAEFRGGGVDLHVNLVKSVIAASLDAIVCADEDGHIILWNRAAEIMFGYPEAEALGRPLTMLLREEDRAAHLAGIRHFLKRGRPHRLIGKVTETFGLRKDGVIFSKEMSLAAEKLEGKWVFTAIMRDISERKRTEDALRREQAQLDVLLDVSRQVNASLDSSVVRRTLVKSAARLMNATSGAAGLIQDGRMVFREYRQGDQWIAVDYVFEPGYGVPGYVMQTGKPYISNDAEHDAHVVPEIRQALDFSQLIDVPILGHSGELLGCFEIHDPVDARPFDDTDVKLLEGLAASAAVALENTRLLEEHECHLRLLHDSEQRFRAISDDVLDTSNVGIFILDADFNVVWINRALELYFGLKRENVLGKDKRRLLREHIRGIFADPERFQEIVFKTYDDNTYVEHFECHVLAAEGREERWLEHWSQPIESGLYAGGRVEHYSDVTDRKRAEAELRQKLDEIERMNRLMVGRELKMEELRREIRRLKEEITELRPG